MSEGRGALELGDLNVEIHGRKALKAMGAKGLWRDIGTCLHLLRKGRWADLSSFRFAKMAVPTGEGSFLCRHTRRIRRPDRVPLPQYVEIEPTTVCNKRCYICEYVHWPPGEQVRRHLSLAEFRYMVDQFPRLRWANVTGEGSAFLNKDYPAMIQYLHREKHASVWFVDHLADKVMHLLEREVLPHVHGIYVSMDAATRETYEKIKIGCNYDNVIENLSRILDYKRKHRTRLPYLTFRYVILPENVHEMPLFLDLLNGMASPGEWGGSGCRVEFTGLLYFDDIKDGYVGQVPREVIRELLARKGGIDFIFSHAEEDKNPPIEKCAAWLEPYIMLPGYVVPCCAVMMSNRRPFLRRYAFGNVFRKDFKAIWDGPYYRKFRKLVNDPGAPVPAICAGCRAYRTRERIARNGVWDVFGDPGCPHEAVTDPDLTIPV